MANRKRWLESQEKDGAQEESWQNEWFDVEYHGSNGESSAVLREDLENAVAAAKFAFIQGVRRPVGRDGRQTEAEYRFREDGQENAEVLRRQR